MPDPRVSRLCLTWSPVHGHIPVPHTRVECMVSLGWFAWLSAVRIRRGPAQHCSPSVLNLCVQQRYSGAGCTSLSVALGSTATLMAAGKALTQPHSQPPFRQVPDNHKDPDPTWRPLPNSTVTGYRHRWAGNLLLSHFESPSNQGPGWACAGLAVGPGRALRQCWHT